jgi:hypothetical protein
MANLTVEELLAKIAEEKKPRRKIEQNSNVKRFIKECNIQPGTKAYPTYVLFWYYRTQWPGDRHNKTNKIAFFRTFSQSFTSYRHGKQRFYLLDEAFLPLTKDILTQADIYERQFPAANSAKKNKNDEETQE